MEAFKEWNDFYERSEAIMPMFLVFSVSGIGLLGGLWMVVVAALNMMRPAKHQKETITVTAE